MRQERVILALIFLAGITAVAYYWPSLRSLNLQDVGTQAVAHVDPCAEVQGVEVWSQLGAVLTKELGGNDQSTHMAEDQCVVRNNALWVHFTPKGDATESCEFFDDKSIRLTELKEVLSFTKCQDDPGNTGGFWSKVLVTLIQAPPPPPDNAAVPPPPADDPTADVESSHSASRNDTSSAEDASSNFANTWKIREQTVAYGEIVWTATVSQSGQILDVDAYKESIGGKPATSCERQTHLTFQLDPSVRRVPYVEVNCDGEKMTGYVQITDYPSRGAFLSDSGAKEGDFETVED